MMGVQHESHACRATHQIQSLNQLLIASLTRQMDCPQRWLWSVVTHESAQEAIITRGYVSTSMSLAASTPRTRLSSLLTAANVNTSPHQRDRVTPAVDAAGSILVRRSPSLE